MTLLYPSFLWLIFPLLLLFSKKKNALLLNTHLVLLMLILIALARPVVKNGLKEQTIEAKNIIIALDVSFSMQAKDISPNRYDFSKETIKAFLKLHPKTNITLIAFTQNALLLSPPTTDHGLILLALKTLNPNYILTKGTSFKNLFDKVASLKSKDKNLLLISDGGEALNIAHLRKQLEEENINLAILGVGTIQGTSIQSKEGLLKDKKGHLIISTLNPQLKSLSSDYSQAQSSPKATAQALDDILNIQERQKIKKLQQSYQEFYHFSLFLALILFFMIHTKAIKYIILLLSLMGISAEASMLNSYHLQQAYHEYQEQEYQKVKKHISQIKTRSLEGQYLLANSAYRLHEYKKAIKFYKSIHSTSIKIKQKLYYNIANSYAKLEQYTYAKKYYIKALQLGLDSDANHNLKMIILKENKKESLGIANPKSQNSKSSKSENQESGDKNKENEPSSASGDSSSGGEASQKKKKKEHLKKQLLLDPNQEQQKQPLSSKLYELINKGYIYEKKPW